MNRALVYTPAFVRAVRRYVKRHPESADAIQAALTLLSADASDPRLRSHKLKGELAGRWSCSAGYDLRIVFRFVEQAGTEAILLLTVGTHDEVY